MTKWNFLIIKFCHIKTELNFLKLNFLRFGRFARTIYCYIYLFHLSISFYDILEQNKLSIF